MSEKIFPPKLQSGDTVMVIAPSDSLGMISQGMRDRADERLHELGLRVVYADNVEELNDWESSSVQSRVSDLHQAFQDPRVKAIIPAVGGYNCNQLLRYIDWDIIKRNPKILLGYSDITALHNAIMAKTGLVTYNGPNYISLGEKYYIDYTLTYLARCLFESDPFIVQPSEYWSDDNWYDDQEDRTFYSNPGYLPIHEGTARGAIIGGNQRTLQLLHGTDYFPDTENCILFLEESVESSIGVFERNLQSLLHVLNIHTLQGLVLGRFEERSQASAKLIAEMINTKQELHDIPVLANANFGHTDPKITFPVGGRATLNVSHSGSSLRIETY